MKLIQEARTKPSRACEGVLLLECVTYISVFAILLGLGFAAFYTMWGNSAALRRTADHVAGALRAGEQWRADIRGATGTIHVEDSADGKLMKIPHGKAEIIYRISGNEVWRKNGTLPWYRALSRIKTSEMEPENRDQVMVWHWDLGMDPRGTGRTKPWLFSFEAVASTK
jgi:hypothetical protein